MFNRICRKASVSLAFAVGLVVLFAPGFALAQTTYVNRYSEASESAAFQNCQGFEQSVTQNKSATIDTSCTPAADPNGGYAVFDSMSNYAGVRQDYYDYPGPPTSPCSMLSNSTSWVSGKVLNGYYTSVSDGLGNMCRVNLQPVTPPMTCGDGWCTLVEYNPTGNGPDTSPVTPAGSVDNSNGQPAQPTVPDYPASGSSAPSNPPRTICGGGSCYDPSTGNACAVGASGQVCINIANSSGATSGGCASSGSTTICGGSPTPPSPVGSQGSTITDPATQIQGSDGYTSANPSTGAATGSTVNVYSSGGSTSSGATSGSVSASKGSSSTINGKSGPASGSSTGDNGDSYGGGGDCNTPPACQGDAVLCGVALQQWRTMCSAHTDAQKELTAWAGSDATQQPPTFASDSTKYSQSDVWQQAGSSGSTTGDAANQGTYDQGGFGYSTSCPMTDLTVSIASASFVMPFSKVCVIGPWIYWTVIGFSLYRAARITAGSAI